MKSRWSVARSPFWWDSDSCVRLAHSPGPYQAFVIIIRYSQSDHGQELLAKWPRHHCLAPFDVLQDLGLVAVEKLPAIDDGLSADELMVDSLETP